MVSFYAEDSVDLESLYSALDKDIEDDWINRLERNFGTSDESHLFVQTDTYNGFLYRDRGTLHLTQAEDWETDPVYQVLESHYGDSVRELFERET